MPADMVVVGVHERYRPNCTGACYVETKSLDGERYRYPIGAMVGVWGYGGVAMYSYNLGGRVRERISMGRWALLEADAS